VKKTLWLLLFVLALPTFAKDSKHFTQKIEATVADFEIEKRFSGAILVAEGDQVIYKKGVAKANHTFGIGNQTDTAFLVGSISKQFTSMIILQLVQEGKMELNAPIGTWFPEFPPYKKEKITVHHLLSHSSGLPHYRGLAEIGIDLETYDRVNRPLEEYAKAIGNMNLLWEPGTRYQYSSQGYILLGIIAQKVTNKSFDQLIQERISKPLGLKNTGFAYNERIVPGLANAYHYGIQQSDEGLLSMGYANAEYRDQTNTFCTGGVHSTVEDLFLWSRALWTNQLLGQELREKMFTVQAKPYGYGWFISNPSAWGLGEDDSVINHGGATTGYRAQIAMLNRGAFTIIVLGNTSNSRSTALAQSISQVLNGKEPRPANILGTAVTWRFVSHGKEEAFALFEKSKESNRYLKNDYAFYANADRLLSFGKPDMALNIAEMGLRLYPNSGALYLNLGDIAVAKGLHKDAMAHFQKAYDLALEFPDENQGVKDEAKEKMESKGSQN